MTEVTRMLNLIEQGDPVASDELLPLVYDDLRILAGKRLANELPGQTLQATALVHEAYVRLIGTTDDKRWDNRGHFSATAMRRILIERARHKQRKIHGGGRQRLELDPDLFAIPAENDDLLALDAALVTLAEHDPVKAKLVELRFFAGLTGDQAAKVLDVSPKTADRFWVYVRAWLRREMEGDEFEKNKESVTPAKHFRRIE